MEASTRQGPPPRADPVREHQSIGAKSCCLRDAADICMRLSAFFGFLLNELIAQLFKQSRRLVVAEVLLDAVAHRLAELRAIRRLADQLADALVVRAARVAAGDRAFASGEGRGLRWLGRFAPPH